MEYFAYKKRLETVSKPEKKILTKETNEDLKETNGIVEINEMPRLITNNLDELVLTKPNEIKHKLLLIIVLLHNHLTYYFLLTNLTLIPNKQFFYIYLPNHGMCQLD